MTLWDPEVAVHLELPLYRPRMTVGDLLHEGSAYLESDFVKQLPESTNKNLAATTLLVGKKAGA